MDIRGSVRVLFVRHSHRPPPNLTVYCVWYACHQHFYFLLEPSCLNNFQNQQTTQRLKCCPAPFALWLCKYSLQLCHIIRRNNALRQ
jgi:hypothetical protein